VVNDSEGHAAGDEQLQRMGQLISKVVRFSDRAFRIGGDEFAMIFECDGAEAAAVIGSELRSRAPGRLGTTLSIGVALAAADETDDAFVERADAALYEVKRRGRDGVYVAPPG
jgi:diguanylate cyclase (GGDEF)-like protein